MSKQFSPFELQKVCSLNVNHVLKINEAYNERHLGLKTGTGLAVFYLSAQAR
jgi:hypothetical protein